MIDEIQRLSAEVEQLKQQIEADHEERRVASIHSKDDQRKQTGRIVRTLENELPMLRDALIALEREPAKVAVAKDCILRALENLHDELNNLRSN